MGKRLMPCLLVVVAGLLIVSGALSLYGSDTIMSSVALGALVRLVFGCGLGLSLLDQYAKLI